MSITEDSIHIARLEERVSHGAESTEVRIARIEVDLRIMQESLTQVLARLNEASGGWKVLLLVGAASATVGSFLTNFFDKLKH